MQIEEGVTEYDLPPDSESNALRQFSAVYSNNILSQLEHMPELLISQDISKLLDLSK